MNTDVKIEQTAHKIDIAVRALVDQEECAMSILQTNRALLDQTAEEFLKTETLNQPEIIKLKLSSNGYGSLVYSPVVVVFLRAL